MIGTPTKTHLRTAWSYGASARCSVAYGPERAAAIRPRVVGADRVVDQVERRASPIVQVRQRAEHAAPLGRVAEAVELGQLVLGARRRARPAAARARRRRRVHAQTSSGRRPGPAARGRPCGRPSGSASRIARRVGGDARARLAQPGEAFGLGPRLERGGELGIAHRRDLAPRARRRSRQRSAAIAPRRPARARRASGARARRRPCLRSRRRQHRRRLAEVELAVAELEVLVHAARACPRCGRVASVAAPRRDALRSPTSAPGRRMCPMSSVSPSAGGCAEAAPPAARSRRACSTSMPGSGSNAERDPVRAPRAVSTRSQPSTSRSQATLARLAGRRGARPHRDDRARRGRRATSTARAQQVDAPLAPVGHQRREVLAPRVEHEARARLDHRVRARARRARWRSRAARARAGAARTGRSGCGPASARRRSTRCSASSSSACVEPVVRQAVRAVPEPQAHDWPSPSVTGPASPIMCCSWPPGGRSAAKRPPPRPERPRPTRPSRPASQRDQAHDASADGPLHAAPRPGRPTACRVRATDDARRTRRPGRARRARRAAARGRLSSAPAAATPTAAASARLGTAGVAAGDLRRETSVDDRDVRGDRPQRPAPRRPRRARPPIITSSPRQARHRREVRPAVDLSTQVVGPDGSRPAAAVTASARSPPGGDRRARPRRRSAAPRARARRRARSRPDGIGRLGPLDRVELAVGVVVERPCPPSRGTRTRRARPGGAGGSSTCPAAAAPASDVARHASAPPARGPAQRGVAPGHAGAWTRRRPARSRPAPPTARPSACSPGAGGVLEEERRARSSRPGRRRSAPAAASRARSSTSGAASAESQPCQVNCMRHARCRGSPRTATLVPGGLAVADVGHVVDVHRAPSTGGSRGSRSSTRCPWRRLGWRARPGSGQRRRRRRRPAGSSPTRSRTFRARMREHRREHRLAGASRRSCRRARRSGTCRGASRLAQRRQPGARSTG